MTLPLKVHRHTTLPLIYRPSGVYELQIKNFKDLDSGVVLTIAGCVTLDR